MEISRKNPLEDYELIEKIGSGTYGDVYKAKSYNTQDFVAIKMIKIDTGDNIGIIQQEINMMKDCQHPNIVAYFNSYIRKDKLWICMEYCGGGSMQDIYHVTGPLNELQIAYICRETLYGLYYLHTNGRMHRDIKGANILLNAYGHVKLADFGVAAQITATLCKRKSFIGSPYWMAPEVAAVERKGGYNHLCDIWALGITAIEFAELQPPMFDLHPMRALFIMSKSGFRPPSLKDKIKWSQTFQNFVKLCLTKNPKRRPTSDKLLEHPFLIGQLDRQLAVELLLKSSNTDDSSYSIHQSLESIPMYTKNFNVEPDINIDNEGVERNGKYAHDATLKASEVVQGTLYDCPQQWVNFKKEIEDNRATLQLTDVGWSSHDLVNDLEEDLRAIDLASHSLPDVSDVHPGQSHSLEFNRNFKSPSNRTFIHGLPPTPEVRMGACLSKIFNDCNLRLNCSASWVHPITKDQHILLGAEEGIYTLNLNELHENTLEILYERRCSWLHVTKDIMMSLCGKGPTLFRHDLISLHNRTNPRFSLTVDKIPIKFVPRKFVTTTKVTETRGTIKCCICRNIYNGYIYLCGIRSNQIYLMQWYDPLNKFMLLKQFDCGVFGEINTFEMFVSPDQEYPLLCTAVRKGDEIGAYKFDIANLNTGNTWLEDIGIINEGIINCVKVSQLERDTILIGYDKNVLLLNMAGKIKPPSRQHISHMRFDHAIEYIVCLPNSILAFNKHGLQGRNLRNNEIIQEISNNDKSQSLNVLGSDKIIVVESRMNKNSFNTQNLSNLFVLTGHENTMTTL